MKKPIIAIATLAVAVSVAGQGKIDPGSRARIRATQTPVLFNANGKGGAKAVRRAKGVSQDVVRAFITVKPNADISELYSLCADVRQSRTGFVLAQIPVENISNVEALDCVKKISVERPVKAKMDIARKVSNINDIHTGVELPQAYTGKGVITGIVDGGFDPNHVNFLDADGNNRIKQFTFFRSTQQPGVLVEQRVTDPAEIATIDTENEDTFHGTHTAGIMAGGYRGKVHAGIYKNAFQINVDEIDNPYYGVAYDSEIVTASAYDGQLSDQYIAYGIETMLDYAYATKQPLAVNLSLGSNIGPHDGTSTICRYLDAVVADDQVNTIVCLSAGNEGDMPITLKHTFSSTDDKIGTGLYAQYDGFIDGYQNPRSGQVYIYSDSAEPFDVQAVIINKKRNAVAMRMALTASPEGNSQYWVSEAGYQQDASDVVSEQFARYLCGYVGIGAEIDADSQRYYSVIDFLTWDNVDGSNADGNYILGFIVSGGKVGQRVFVYGDAGMCNFSSFGLDGYVDGEFDGTVSDIATGYNTIVVGSYNTRDDWASVDGARYGYQNAFPYGQMSAFTSFGTLIDGRTKPDICAPGATVISSSNEYYLDAVNYGDAEKQAVYSDGNRSYSWHQCVGTSMAAPVVTGTMALWLEAYPELKAADARRILAETAVKDAHVNTTGNPVQWGAGKLDAYAGLKKVLELKNAGVDNVLADNDNRVMVKACGQNAWEVFMAGADSISVEVYSLTGAKVMGIMAENSQVEVDASALHPGVYILKVNNNYSQKITVK